MSQKPEFHFNVEEKKFYARKLSFKISKFLELCWDGAKAYFTGNPDDAIGAVKNLLGIVEVSKDLEHEAAVAIFTAWFKCLGAGLEKIPTSLTLEKIQHDDSTESLKDETLNIADIGQRFLEDTELFQKLSKHLRNFLTRNGEEQNTISLLDQFMRENFSRQLRFLLCFKSSSFPKFKQLYFDIQTTKNKWKTENNILTYRDEVLRSYTSRQILQGVYLKDVFIPPRWQFHSDNILIKEIGQESSMVETVVGLLEMDQPLVILGEPGHGKTSFAHYLAYYLASKPEFNLFPIVGEFKNIKPEMGWRGLSIQTEEYLQADIPQNKRVLFILDGLDEIVGATASPAQYKDFIRDLLVKVDLYQRQHAGGNVLITSRTHFFEDHKNWIPAEFPCQKLNLKEFSNDQITQWLQKFKTVNTECEITLETLQKNNLISKTSSNEEEDIVRLPVILTTLVDTFPKMGTKNILNKSQIESRFTLYQAIVEKMHFREQEKRLSRPENRLPLKTPDEFSQFFERLACILFLHGKTQLDFRTIRDNWEKFGNFKPIPIFAKYDDEQWKLRLLFYFKTQKDIEGELSRIEFLHKSFYDFFIAKSILRRMEKLTHRLKEEDEPETSDFAFELMKVASGIPLEGSVRSFLIEGFKSLEKDNRICTTLVKNYLIKVFQEMNDHHFIGDPNIQQFFGKNLHKYSVHVLINLFIVLKFISRNDEPSIWGSSNVCVEKKETTMKHEGFSSFFSYINSLEKDYFSQCNIDFYKTNFSNQNCQGMHLYRFEGMVCNWENADLRDADLSASFLAGSYFNGTDLTGVNFAYTDLSGSDLSEVSLAKADLHRSRLNGVFGKKSSGPYVKYGPVTFLRPEEKITNLSKADLAFANLCESKLDGIDLSEANLFQANLMKAHLKDTELKNSNLAGANLIDAKGVTQEQIDGAFINEETLLPKGLSLKMNKRKEKKILISSKSDKYGNYLNVFFELVVYTL